MKQKPGHLPLPAKTGDGILHLPLVISFLHLLCPSYPLSHAHFRLITVPGIPDQIPVRRHFPLLYQQNNSRAAKLKASLLLASLYLSRVMIIDDFPTIRAPTSIISTSPKWEL